MNVFISQRMRNRAYGEIWHEFQELKGWWVSFLMRTDEKVLETMDVLESFFPKLKDQDPITSLSQSLKLMAKADVVLVPFDAVDTIKDINGLEIKKEGTVRFTNSIFSPQFIRQSVKGCELELLVALSYGKKVYVYFEKEGRFHFTRIDKDELFCGECGKLVKGDYYKSNVKEVLCLECGAEFMNWECYKYVEPIKLIKNKEDK